MGVKWKVRKVASLSYLWGDLWGEGGSAKVFMGTISTAGSSGMR